MLFLFSPGSLRRTDVADASDNDSELARVAQADPRAFTALYERYVSPIYAYCLIRLNDREAAEDATSEVFVKALAGLGGYRNGVFAAWLFQIAHNVVVDAQRKRHPQPLTDADTLPAPGLTVEDAAVERMTRQDLRAALTQLSEEQRTVIEMQCAGWSGPRIAAALGKSLTAVRMLRFRAVERLRDLIASGGNG